MGRENLRSSKSKEVMVRKQEERHKAEIKGLAKQIQYLRAKAEREKGFRADLAFSKSFFLMQVELYSSWYVLIVKYIEV
jgi:hypothetical protein